MNQELQNGLQCHRPPLESADADDGGKRRKGEERDTIGLSRTLYMIRDITVQSPCRMDVSRYNEYHSKTDPLRRRMQDKDARVSAAGH